MGLGKRLTFVLITVSTILVLMLLSFGHDAQRSRLQDPVQNDLPPSQETISGGATKSIITVLNTQPLSEKFVNPGCISRKFHTYKPIDTGVVYQHPPVVQYAKLSTTNSPVSLTFMDYMAMMSAYRLLQPERIMIHTYTNIQGKYWDLAQKWENTIVEMNKVERVRSFGRSSYVQITHQADYTKLQGLLKFGGIVSDFDVIIVNGSKLKHMQRISECVLSGEGNHINAGFSSCVKNSSFIRAWIDTYHKDYRPDWLHNSAFKPKDILEKNTEVCYNVYLVLDIATKPTYAKADKEWLAENGVEWEAKVAAHYFSKRIRQFDESVLKQGHSFGKMLRFVTNA